jgi:hypothetical protein
MGKSIKQTFSNPIRGLTAVSTFGGSELARRSKIPGLNQLARLPETASDSILGTRYGRQGAQDLQGFNGGQNPAELLAQTGGAPLLANIAMGVDPQDALAGYFGKSKQDGSWEEFLGTLSQADLDRVNSVHGQLNTIQKDRTLRQKAVDSVIADFPNLAKNAAQARAQAGGEFDEVTRGYMEQALGQTAAKYAAGGGLSSGAANQAFAKTGADMAMQKLDFMGQREQNQYNMDANVLNTRLAEVNALRDFQNTMLGGGIQQGFSAQQANLQRQFQGQQFNAGLQEQRYQADQQGKNALFGALGSLGGSFLGAKMLGGSMGTNLFGSPAPKLTTNNLLQPKTAGLDGYGGR